MNNWRVEYFNIKSPYLIRLSKKDCNETLMLKVHEIDSLYKIMTCLPREINPPQIKTYILKKSGNPMVINWSTHPTQNIHNIKPGNWDTHLHKNCKPGRPKLKHSSSIHIINHPVLWFQLLAHSWDCYH